MYFSIFKKYSPVLMAIFVIVSGIAPVGAMPSGFHVYFNDPNESSGNGMDEALVNFINSANTTIAAAFYSTGRSNITDAFIEAASRIGPENIRFITDYNNRGSSIQKLEAAGITVIDETWDDNISESQAGNIACHNKFCVVDGVKVWTGSYNITTMGTIRNANNAIAVECESLAQAYLAEFNEMWGADSGPPGNCHFSSHKKTQYEHHHVCSGVPVDVYFSPTTESYPNRAMDIIDTLINDADSEVLFCLFAFTSNSIADKIIKAKDRGVKVQGVMDADQASYSSSKYNMLVDAGVDVILHDEVNPRISMMHHKFAVIDAHGDNPAVVAGSYNWSQAAQYTNDENSIFIYNSDVAEKFWEEEYRMYNGEDPPQEDIKIEIDSNQSIYYAGNYMRIWVDITNSQISETANEYVILDLGEAFGENRYYFWPEWSNDPVYKRLYLSPGDDIEQEILSLVLPSPLSPCGPFTIYAALLNPTTNTLLCDYDYLSFRFE